MRSLSLPRLLPRLLPQFAPPRLFSSTPSQPPSPSPAPPSTPEQKAPSSPFDLLGTDLVGAPTLGSLRASIDALGPTSFTISGVRVAGSVLVMPDFSTLWNVDSVDQIVPQAFALVKLIRPRPDVVFVGTGAQLLPVSPELRDWFRGIGVSVESMDTKNACHTFNVLNQEARNVAAALLPASYVPRPES